METKERIELIRLHEEALEVYKRYPKIWQKEIREKILLIAKLKKEEGKCGTRLKRISWMS